MLHDPLFTSKELAGLESDVVEIGSDRAADAEAVIVNAWHRDFAKLDWRGFKHLRAVLDGRGAVEAEKVRAAGATYIAIGSSRSRASTPK
jgi:UDP-N-acetyl-D-mannosaminuronate dehydrogenase